MVHFSEQVTEESTPEQRGFRGPGLPQATYSLRSEIPVFCTPSYFPFQDDRNMMNSQHSVTIKVPPVQRVFVIDKRI